MNLPKTLSSTIKIKAKEVKDYVSLISEATQLFELYTINMQLEILKGELLILRKANRNDEAIIAEINLASELQEQCKRRV